MSGYSNQTGPAMLSFRKTVGKRLSTATFRNYKISSEGQKDVVDFLKKYSDSIVSDTLSENGLVLYGPPGTGKDHLLIATAKPTVWTGMNVEWVSAIDICRKPIKSFDLELAEVSETPQILVLSGVSALYFDARMVSLIKHRRNTNRPTWISITTEDHGPFGGPFEQDVLKGFVDALRPFNHCLLCNWESYRKPK